KIRAPLLKILDQLATQDWQLHFPYHRWYSYLGYLVSGVSSMYQDREKDWNEPSLVREKLLPLIHLPEERENGERNVMKDEMLYCVNEHIARGAIYPTLTTLNNQPVAMTRAKKLEVRASIGGEEE